MCRTILLSLLLLHALPAAGGARPRMYARARPLAITNVTVIDATGAPARPGMTVLIEGDRIAAVGAAGAVRVPRGARVFDARGKFLIPGLWDMHVHLVNAGEAALPLFVAYGVTGVRDMGGRLSAIRSWRGRIAAGALVGPRIKAAGAVLESASFVGHVARVEEILKSHHVEPVPEEASRLRRPVSVATAGEARRAVRAHARSGVDFIKARTFENRETYFAIAAEARRLGLPFVGHVATPQVSLAESSDAGQRSFEHMFFLAGNLEQLSDAQRGGLYARLVRNGTWLVPTITTEKIRTAPDEAVKAEAEESLGGRSERGRTLPGPLASSFRRDLQVRLLEHSVEPPHGQDVEFRQNVGYLRAMHRAGVRMLPGTDLAGLLVFPGSSLHEELRLFVEEVGMSPMEALRSATHHPAEFFGLLGSLGTVERGKLADLVLLEADPLADIGNTRKISAVVLNGRLLDRKALDGLLAAPAPLTPRVSRR